MKRILLISVILAAMLLSACAAPVTTPEPTPTPAESAPAPAPAPTTPPSPPEPTPSPEPEPKEPFEIEESKFEGTGDSVSPEFELPEGVTMIGMWHNGSSNFIVELMGTSGETIDLLVNRIGPYEGMRAIGIQKDAITGASPGAHVLGITADGNWRFGLLIMRNLSEYEFDPEERLPVSFSGRGDGVATIFPVEEDGIVRFTLTHDGERNFIVTLLDAEHGTPTLLVNEIGSYQGTKAVGFKKGAIIEPEPGNYFVDIIADGNWSIKID